MHLDILDTVLVSQKDPSTLAPGTTTEGEGGTTKRLQPNMKDAAADADAEAKCPVDHKARETWLAQARAAAAAAGDGQGASSSSPPSGPDARPAGCPSSSSGSTNAASQSTWKSWGIPFFSHPSSEASPAAAAQQQDQGQRQIPSFPPRTDASPALDTTRQVSSIPRASIPSPNSSRPANNESETDADPATGNWVYPSERQFFDAMRRKALAASDTTTTAATAVAPPRPADMRTVVPIHNAVNERAWAEIRAWEAPHVAGTACAAVGPRLHSFAGVKGRMTPRARVNTLLGYTAPFDRHDWVVDRCGTRVDYVIDFYAGRGDGKGGVGGDGKVNFYLDVRPKLNSWEGVKMRAMRGLGLV